jgi:hydroxymethylpyrimidine/phosphomethylpyrimidine kinase
MDLFFDGSRLERFSSPRIDTHDVHGTGCVLSAALTANLALGHTVYDAVARAKQFVTEAIKGGLRLGNGAGPVNAGRITPS